jgi:small ligand-binding sensory domain FIST
VNERFVFASAKTKQRGIPEAVQELVGTLKPQLFGAEPDIAIMFMSSHFRSDAATLSYRLRGELKPQNLIGCTAGGVIGRDEEIEDEPGISVLAARLPNVDVVPFELAMADWESFLSDPDALSARIGAVSGTKLLLVMADPFSTPIEPLLSLMNDAFPDIPVAGGLASSPESENVLLLNARTLHAGMVGVAISGALEADVIVSQGCRPVGRPFKVTSARSNVILSLEGEPPLERIREVIVDLTNSERELLGNGLFIGRAVRPSRSDVPRGGFLIRGVTGVEENSGVIAIGDDVADGEIVQFHLRDAATAVEDLEMMLTPQSMLGPASGGLIFTCNGRGKRLYHRANGDISILRSILGDLCIGGFFCAGEIGPIGGRNYLHGHTASVVLIRPQRPTETVQQS